jgi:hypothetical protein
MVHATLRNPIMKLKPLEFHPEPSVTLPKTSAAECLFGVRTKSAMHITTDAKTIICINLKTCLWNRWILTVDRSKPHEHFMKPQSRERTDQAHYEQASNANGNRYFCGRRVVE